MIRRASIILVLFLALMPIGTIASDDGGTESVFNLGAGARAMGMGNGFVGLADDATAVYYNPAGMPYLRSQQISFLHSILFQETIYDFVSYVYPHSEVGSFGIAGMRIGTDDIGRRDATFDLGRFNASQMQILLSYGRAFGKRYSAGASLKLVHQSIDNYSAYGYGFDLGGRVCIIDGLSGGVMIQDLIGARLKLANAKERTPFTLKTGLAYRFSLADSPLSGTVTFDLDKPEHRNAKIHPGLEVVHSSGIALRTGFDRDNVTLGMGIIHQNLAIDYAYKFVDRLTDSHRFSLTYSFGPTRAEEDARRDSLSTLRDRRVVSESRQEMLRQEMTRAEAYYRAGELDSALAAYYRADAYAVDKTEINGRIAAVRRALAAREGMRQADTVARPGVGLAGMAAGFERQVDDLYRAGSLIEALNALKRARRYSVVSDRLDQLESQIRADIADSVAANLARGEGAFAVGDYVTAYDCYNTALSYDKENAAGREGSRRAKLKLDVTRYLTVAVKKFRQENYRGAESDFTSVIELDPGNEIAKDYLERIALLKEEPGPSRDLQDDPEIRALYVRGLEAFRDGDYEKAIDYWEQVLKVYPNDKNTLENIKQARLRLNP